MLRVLCVEICGQRGECLGGGYAEWDYRDSHLSYGVGFARAGLGEAGEVCAVQGHDNGVCGEECHPAGGIRGVRGLAGVDCEHMRGEVACEVID